MSTIKTLTNEEVMAAIETVRNGAFIRLGYKSEPPLKAANKKAGYKVVKITECTGRLGVHYGNIKSVIEHKAAMPVAKTPKPDNYYWIVENKIAGNTKTGKKYLRMTTTKHSNTKSQYIVYNAAGEDVSDTVNYEDLIIPSYFGNKGDPSPVRNITLENIIRIDKVGEEFKEV